MYNEAKTAEDFKQIDEIERNKTPAKTGDIMLTTWGYDMTLNDYCKVLENTGKTVKCVMIDKIVTDDTGIGNGRSMPCPDVIISPPFRLHVRMRAGNEGFTYWVHTHMPEEIQERDISESGAESRITTIHGIKYIQRISKTVTLDNNEEE